jgi:penicillin-binding protein 1A
VRLVKPPARSVAWLGRLGLVIGAGALLVTAVVVAVAPRIWQVANAHEELPVVLPAFQPLAQRSYAYDVFGNEISVFEAENSQPIPLAQVPDRVIDAFLAVEDREFYNHHGVNLRALVRATLSNFSSEDSAQQGASTITMQVVKNDFLAGLERDGRYKLLQVHYALMLENAKTKDEILERYLNTVFLGNNAYGIQAASEVYFGKTVDELTFIEAAFLAGLVRSPSGYDPVIHPERSRSRFRQVLDRLIDAERLTPEQADQEYEDFVLPDRARTTPGRINARGYYTEALRDFLLNKSNLLGQTYDERYATLFRGGLRIYTTFDPFLQAWAEESRNILPDTQQGFDASLVTLDTKTGAIRAMVGGRGFVPNERETNMALAPRQTGSSIKLFVLAAAIQAGAQPDDVIDGAAGCVFDVPDEDEPFDVSRSTKRASDTLARMTWSSINCAYVRLSMIVGLNRVVDTTYRMAQSNYLYPGQPVEDREPIQPFISFSTGANEMSPLDMAAGGQTLANNGVHHQPYYVERIDTADGRNIYTHDDPGTQVLDEGAALTTVDTLKGVLTDGTAEGNSLEGGRPAAGKTGTQQDNTNAWFVGFTPQLTTAVWVGDPNGYTPMVNVPEFEGENSARVQGGRYPAQIWKAFMDKAHANLPIEDWQVPPAPARAAALLYLPGNQCIARRTTPVVPGQPGASTTTTTGPLQPFGFRAATPTTTPPETAAPTTQPPPPSVVTVPPTAAATPPPTPPPAAASEQPTQVASPQVTTPRQSSGAAPTTTPRTTPTTRPERLEPGTTISPDVLDPRAPMPSAPLASTAVVPC